MVDWEDEEEGEDLYDYEPKVEDECSECGEPCDGDLCDDCAEELGFDYDDCDDSSDDYDDDDFADPYGMSALRAENVFSLRNFPCPTCGRDNMLTSRDRNLGYQCDICAEEIEKAC